MQSGILPEKFLCMHYITTEAGVCHPHWQMQTYIEFLVKRYKIKEKIQQSEGKRIFNIRGKDYCQKQKKMKEDM